MGALQEVDLDDVRQILHASAVADQDTAVAVADQDTAVAVPDQDSAVSVPDLALRRKATKWATISTYDRFITSLLDMLPPAVLDEQMRLYQGRSCGLVVPHAPRAIVVYTHLLKSRQEAARLFHTGSLNAGWAPGTRLPRLSATKFAKQLVWPNITTLSNAHIIFRADRTFEKLQVPHQV